MPDQNPVEGLTGVGWHFSASHRDNVRQELHGHSYEVTAWFDHKPARDARVLQEHLKHALSAFDHKTLSDEMSRSETLAAAIMRVTDAAGVELRRPLERIYAKVGRCG